MNEAGFFWSIIQDGQGLGAVFCVIVCLVWYILRQEKKIENKDELTKTLNALRDSIAQIIKTNEELKNSYEKSNLEMRGMYKEILTSQFNFIQKDIQGLDSKADKLLDYCIKKGDK